MRKESKKKKVDKYICVTETNTTMSINYIATKILKLKLSLEIRPFIIIKVGRFSH